MKALIDNLKISEVLTISGAKRPALQKWIDAGMISAPRVIGGNRSFSARDTIEVVLMVKLISVGLKASVAGEIAVFAAPSVLAHYMDDWAEQRGDEIVMGVRWVLVANLNPPPSFIGPRVLVEVGRAEALERFRESDWLKIELAPLIGGALTRALALQRNRGSRPQRETRE